MLRTVLPVAACAVGLLLPSVPAQDLLGVNFAGDVFAIDSATGVETRLGAAGVTQLNSLARRSDGRIYSFTSTEMVTLDPTNGAITSRVPLTVTELRAAAFDPADNLFVIVNGFPDSLHRVDPDTGAATFVGDTGFFGLQSLEWFGGTLYGWECGAGAGTGVGLVTIDPQTGVTQDVNPAINGTCDQIQSLVRDGKGGLLGGRDSLWRVDPATGALALIGGRLSDIRGLAPIAPICSLALLAPTPGTVGTANAVPFQCASPNGTVALLVGTIAGAGPAFYCDQARLGFVDPDLLAFGQANGNGDGRFVILPPPPIAGVPLLFQMLDLASCGTSPVQSVTFR